MPLVLYFIITSPHKSTNINHITIYIVLDISVSYFVLLFRVLY